MGNRLLSTRILLFTVTVFLSIFTTGLVTAQTATIQGIIIDSETGETLPSANVFIEELQRGASTDVEGRFEITNIDPGSYTITFNFIGYRATTREIDLSSDEVLELEVELSPDRIGLDQVVVTGQAGTARQREVGSSVGSIQADDIIASSSNVENLIQGQVAGVNILQTSGSSGAGGQIRIRGNVSVSMSNQPLIYLDGIRLRSDPFPENVPR